MKSRIWNAVTEVGRLGIVGLLVLMPLAVTAPAFGQGNVSIESTEARHAGEFRVPINKSQVLRLDVPFSDLLIGNDQIADVLALTDQTVYVLGRQLGSTSLTIYGSDGNLIAVLDLVVTVDVDGLKARLFELFPDEEIEIRPVNEAIILSGQVSSASRLERIMAIADRYVGGRENVTNLMTIEGSQQVMLSVRFAEIGRGLGRELGFNTALIGSDFSLITGIGPALDAFVTGTLSFTGLFGTNTSLDILFDALEEKNLAKVLAEPNLIALSGDTASFLAGGEFPIPVAQDTSTTSGGAIEGSITIEFKEFGVSLAFTPTVLDDGLINIIVSPEVSQIDNTFAQVVNGLNVPGLTVRRATTTVEVRDGQSFAIAGLLQSTFQDTINQFPVLGDVPIIGALFRSTEFQRNETELVIVVTPRLVQPAAPELVSTPTDHFVPPDDFELFALGRLESETSGEGAPGQMDGLLLNDAGGIQGQFGHIIK